MEVKSNAVKNNIAYEPGMNQGFMNQGKLEIAKVNIDILQISELKSTRMGGFNSDYIYCLSL